MNLFNYVYLKNGQVVGSQVSFIDDHDSNVEFIKTESDRYKQSYNADDVKVFSYNETINSYLPVDVNIK